MRCYDLTKWVTGLVVFSLIHPSFAQQENVQPGLLIRCDDIGMCQAVNLAAEKLIAAQVPFSASIMFACPWYQQAVDLLRGHSQVSVGVHLTINSEWKNYRWGPVAGWQSVPSLVDSNGYFFPSRALLFANEPKLEEVEIELRAQILRAKQSGLRIDYVDYHMGSVVSTEPLRQLVERLAQENGWAISRYLGEKDIPNMYAIAPQAKQDSLVRVIAALSGNQRHLLVCHIGMDTPEMAALEDLNTFGLKTMSKHREAELSALISPAFRDACRARDVKLITYRDLIQHVGLQNVKRPD